MNLGIQEQLVLCAFAKSVEANELKMGDYVIFWTVGAGTTCPTVLYKY